MKIFRNQMFRSFNKWCFGAIAFLLFAGTFDAQAQGEALFKSKCATCHQPLKDGTGPKLSGVRAKWEAGGAKPGSIFKWVNNWQAAAASDPYAMEVSKTKPTAMNLFPDLTEEQITSIFDWVDAQVAAPVDNGNGGDASAAGTQVTEESDFSWTWVLLGVVFVVIILGIGGVRRQLKVALDEKEGNPVRPDMSYADEFRSWAWKNKIYVGIASLILVLTLLVTGIQGLGEIGVVEAYQPSQPIDFPHTVHAGVNGIDCKYCHNSVTKSKTAGLPTVNVCMNCHKQINGRDATQADKIKAIYAAAGWDPAGSVYTNKTSPIKWNKVHVLPDHVYFNHSQHVTVGGIDCKQCHGDMKTQKETARVVPVSELNKIEGNIPLTKPTLTMGWCIECHQEKGISEGPLAGKGGYYDEIHRRLLNNDRTLYSKYLEDGKVSVKELGGWECAKCHY